MVDNGPQNSKFSHFWTQNGPEWSTMVQNGRRRNGPEWSTMVQNGHVQTTGAASHTLDALGEVGGHDHGLELTKETFIFYL